MNLSAANLAATDTSAISGVGLTIAIIIGIAIWLVFVVAYIKIITRAGYSGWWVLIGLIPLVGVIVLIVFFVQDSHGDNQYGPSPKAVEPGYGSYGQMPPPVPPTSQY